MASPWSHHDELFSPFPTVYTSLMKAQNTSCGNGAQPFKFKMVNLNAAVSQGVSHILPTKHGIYLNSQVCIIYYKAIFYTTSGRHQ